MIPGLGRSPGEGNGNPLQYYCLENPMDRGAWQAAVYGVAKNRTRLSDFTSLLLAESCLYTTKFTVVSIFHGTLLWLLDTSRSILLEYSQYSLHCTRFTKSILMWDSSSPPPPPPHCLANELSSSGFPYKRFSLRHMD